jgi:hypothetical protein
MASVTVCEIMMTHANFITLTEQMSRMAMNASTSVAQFSQKNARQALGDWRAIMKPDILRYPMSGALRLGGGRHRPPSDVDSPSLTHFN